FTRRSPGRRSTRRKPGVLKLLFACAADCSETVQDKPVEIIGRRLEPPPEMMLAARAYRHPPGIALEPGVRFGRRPRREASCGFAETADPESVAGRVGACVFVAAVHWDSFVLLGDGVPAQGAEQPFLFSCFVYGMDVGLLLAAGCAAPVEEQWLR